MKRSHGSRNRTRSRLRKNVREKGMPPVTHSLREFSPGDRVSIRINSAIHKGMPHPRFQGKTGVVKERQGRAFCVQFRDGNKTKIAICGPEHLVLQE
jgi:large subunit ribosomal protein L21e